MLRAGPCHLWSPIGFALLCCLGSALSSASQAPEPESAVEPPIVIEQSDLPQYFVVQAFFDRARAYRDDESPWPYYLLLEDLGIEPGSGAAERLETALSEAQAVRAIPTIDPRIEDGDAFWDFQINALRTKARLLGGVFWALLRDLKELGDVDERLMAYLETEVRPNSSLVAERGWPTDTLDAARSFDRELERLKNGGRP